MPDRLQGKVAIITGAGSSGPGWGNGKAMAVLFAREGASVFGVDIKQAAVEETCGMIESEGGTALAYQANVADAQAVAAMVSACIERFGRIDILVNNVGIVEVGGPVDYSLEAWQRVLDVNLTSMFLTCKYVIPHMEAQGRGSIVQIGSIAGIRWTGVPYISYSSTKAAILGFSRSIALQYAAKQIRSNVVLPGLMKTPFVVEPLKQIYAGGDIERMMQIRDQQCPMGHMGDAWDVAYAALFLASDEARYITAAELLVDGGITAKFA